MVGHRWKYDISGARDECQLYVLHSLGVECHESAAEKQWSYCRRFVSRRWVLSNCQNVLWSFLPSAKLLFMPVPDSLSLLISIIYSLSSGVMQQHCLPMTLWKFHYAMNDYRNWSHCSLARFSPKTLHFRSHAAPARDHRSLLVWIGLTTVVIKGPQPLSKQSNLADFWIT